MDDSVARDTVASMADAVITVDSEGRITSWNSAATRLLGHTAHDAIGETLALIIPSEHRSRHIGAFRAAMESGRLAHQGRPALIEATHSDQHRVNATMTLGLLLDHDHIPSGVVAVLRPAAESPILFAGQTTPSQ